MQHIQRESPRSISTVWCTSKTDSVKTPPGAPRVRSWGLAHSAPFDWSPGHWRCCHWSLGCTTVPCLPGHIERCQNLKVCRSAANNATATTNSCWGPETHKVAEKHGKSYQNAGVLIRIWVELLWVNIRSSLSPFCILQPPKEGTPVGSIGSLLAAPESSGAYTLRDLGIHHLRIKS